MEEKKEGELKNEKKEESQLESITLFVSLRKFFKTVYDRRII